MVKNYYLMIFLFAICTFCTNSYAQVTRGVAVANTNLDPEEYLTIKLKEKGVFLGVKEPANWMGDLVRAGDHYADAMFYQNIKTFKSGGALIKVIVYNKADENTIADLEFDTKQFKAENKKANHQDLNLQHSEYVTFSRLSFIKKGLYEYVTYLNPGREYKTGILVTMQVYKRPANNLEAQIYDEIVRSIHLMPIEDNSIQLQTANP